MSEYFKRWAQSTIHPSKVAKVILQAVNSDNPDFRYVVGKDAVMALESKRNMFVNPGLQKVAREIDSRQLRIEIYFSRR